VPSFLVALIPIAIIVATVLVVRVWTRRRTRERRPAREPSAFVLLDANMWDACSVDDVREPWSRYTTEPIRGFCGVVPGRHRIRTITPNGEATLDFVVYPGEVLAWRLDADRTRWEPYDLDAETRASLEAAPASSMDLGLATRPKLPGWLVHLRTTMNLVSDRASASSRGGDDGVDRLKKRLAKLVSRVEGDGDAQADLLAEARGLGEAIVGRALARKEMRALVAPSRDVATRLVDGGDADRAMRVIALGLAVLPGDPELMVVAGCALAERGVADEALRALNAALERDRCLEPEDVARAMRARLELRSRLGRSVRVG